MISIDKTTNIPLSSILRRTSVAQMPNAEATLRECILRSQEVRYGFIDGEIACIWGLIPPSLLSTTAYLWLLTTDIAAEHKFLFVRHSQRYVEEALKSYPTIVGDVNARNLAAQKWLKWLGAIFGESDGEWIKFMILKKVANG